MMRAFLECFSTEAKKRGIGHFRFHAEESERHAFNVYEGELEKYTVSRETLLCIEGEVDGRIGTAYTEKFADAGEGIPDQPLIASLVENIRQTAGSNGIPYTEKPLGDLALPDDDETEPEGGWVTEQLIAAENEAFETDPRVAKVSRCGFSSEVRKIVLQDQSGRRMEDRLRCLEARVSVMVRDGDRVQTAAVHGLSHRGDLDLRKLAVKAAAEAAAMLPAESLPGGRRPVVIRGDVFCELLYAYLPLFYADRVQSGTSLMKGKLNQSVAAPMVNLYEDPTSGGGTAARRFDDEGTPTQTSSIIDGGYLATYLHNLKTARASGIASTGNGFRRMYRENVAVSATNIVLWGGKAGLPELIRSARDGVLVTHCDGIFAGANVFSGDFSLISRGFLIEGGKVTRPAHRFTIGGNFFDLLHGVSALGDDYFTTGHIRCSVRTPSVLVKKLLISGRE